MNNLVPLTVKIIIDRKSKDAPFVAYTPELDIASCGPTEAKARDNLKTAVRVTLEEIQKKGQLRNVLEELGFQKDATRGWTPPSVSFEPFYFPTV